MAILPIITAPDPRLKIVSEPVATVNDDVRRLMDDMLETMYAAPGIGLAAIQVGVAKRVIVMDISDPEQPAAPLFFVNPRVTWTSEERIPVEEGCLSVPEYYAEVERPTEATVTYVDYHGREQEMQAKGMLAVCVQHEIDHLDGILFIDYLSSLKRNMVLRKLAKSKRLEAVG